MEKALSHSTLAAILDAPVASSDADDGDNIIIVLSEDLVITSMMSIDHVREHFRITSIDKSRKTHQILSFRAQDGNSTRKGNKPKITSKDLK